MKRMNTKMTKFFDTCSLLQFGNSIIEENNKFFISSLTLNELESIKNSNVKDEEIKCEARRLLRLLHENQHLYTIILYTEEQMQSIEKCYPFPRSNDIKILATAWSIAVDTWDDLTNKSTIQFVTGDLTLYQYAKILLGQKNVLFLVDEKKDNYTGFVDVEATDRQIEQFYTAPTKNLFKLHTNQYLILRNIDGELIDKSCWTGEEHRALKPANFSSPWFKQIKPMKGDVYQQFAADSLINNKITMLTGPAGTGKTFLSMGFLMSQMNSGKIDKIIVFCNTVATRNAAKLGYYPGTKDEKLLDSQIGNLLISKFGGRVGVEQLMYSNKLELLPMSDIRGFDTTGMKAGVYISEAQNLDITLMKLALQRVGEDSICIIDGDANTQVDDLNFAGAKNGMKRASIVFRGSDIYGEVMLQNIYRSKIAGIAERM